MKNKGFSLIETIVVFAILSVLALVGVESIIEFQKNALLEGTANEFASTLRSARTKSIAGQLLEGENPEDFEEQGLPKYGVRVEDETYFLFREYQLVGEPSLRRDNLEAFIVINSLSLSPSGGEALFNRVTGISSPITFTLQRSDGRGVREIEASDKGVTLRKL